MYTKASGAVHSTAWLLFLLTIGCGASAPPTQTGPQATPSLAAGSGGWNGRTAPPHLLLAEKKAYERAQPVFEKHCARCHTSTGMMAKEKTLAHFNMDSYPFGGHHQAEMTRTIRKVLGATGEPPTMPRDDKGAVEGDDLALVLAWADSFDRSNANGKRKHSTPKQAAPKRGSHSRSHQH